MRIVIKTVTFQILCVLLFGLIYISYKNHFIRDTSYTIDKNKEILRSGTWATIRKAKKLNKTIYLL